MFLRDDGIIDKQLERLARRSSSCNSWSSFSTAESTSDGKNYFDGSDAMIEALIRDLSFWGAAPPSGSLFPSPLPQNPNIAKKKLRQQYQYQRQQYQPQQSLVGGNTSFEAGEFQPQMLLQRGRHVMSREQLAITNSNRSSTSITSSTRSNGKDKSKSRSKKVDRSNWELPQTVWKTAVDPMTGRTYYYDAVTRRTQWEKPQEVKQIEKQKKAQRRKRDKSFFKEMEVNILRSLSLGELIPGIPKAQLEPSGPPLEPVRNAKTPFSGPRNYRTLSRMDDTILAELRDDVVSPEEFDRAMQATKQSRTKQPRSNSRGRPPLPAPTNSSGSRSRQRQELETSDVPTACSSNKPPIGLPTGRRRNASKNSGIRRVPEQALSEQTAEGLVGKELLEGPLSAEMETLAASEKASNFTHVRRNTGGTIYMNGTMSNPNVEATIKCVCGVYRAHLVQASEQRKHSPVSVVSKQAGLDLEVFNDRYHVPSNWKHAQGQNHSDPSALPSLSDIVDFYQEFYSRSQMEFDTIIMSLIYVERLIKTTSLTPGPENWRSVLFSCMVLASKVWDDLSMWNIDFSNVVSAHSQEMALFTLQRVNQLELILLKSLNFNVRVPASEYAKYYFLIRTMLMRSGLLEGPAEPLGKEEAKGLENRTRQYQDSKLGGADREQRDGRRTQSMYDYSWLTEKSSKNEEHFEDSNGKNDNSSMSSRLPQGGPVLKDKVCLEQLVKMSGWQ